MVRIASTGEVMLIVVFARPEQEKIDDLMGAIAAEFPEITSLLYVVNQKVNDTIADQEVITYRGRDYINEEMEGLQFASARNHSIRQTPCRHTSSTKWRAAWHASSPTTWSTTYTPGPAQ